MDHSEAEHIKAVERYALRDLAASEVEEFERHFFECPQCSEELRLLAVFQDNARAVFLEPAPRPAAASLPAPTRRAGWWTGLLQPLWQRQWAVTFAALLIGIFAGYEVLVVVPGLRHQVERANATQSISAFPLYALARGEETRVAPLSGAQFYTLYMDRTWERDFASYRAVVRDDPGGAERTNLDASVPAPGKALQILISARTLPAGRYILVMFGVDQAGRQTEVARYPFTLRFQ